MDYYTLDLIILTLCGILVLVSAWKIADALRGFPKRLRRVNQQIAASEGGLRERYKRKRKELWLSLIPFYTEIQRKKRKKEREERPEEELPSHYHHHHSGDGEASEQRHHHHHEEAKRAQAEFRFGETLQQRELRMQSEPSPAKTEQDELSLLRAKASRQEQELQKQKERNDRLQKANSLLKQALSIVAQEEEDQ